MDFARKELEKYGWINGKGLGKNGDGISEPIKPKLKHSLTGVGYDPAADFKDHWWSKLYDKAASNLEISKNRKLELFAQCALLKVALYKDNYTHYNELIYLKEVFINALLNYLGRLHLPIILSEVENENGSTKKIRRKSDEEFEITNGTWKIKKKKKEITSEEEYSEFFVKTVVIGVGGEETTRVKTSDSESENEDDEKSTTKMTDEQLFAACGGRTAHKGARHGLRALGKLARIEQQEQILLQQQKYKGYSHFNKGNKTSHESKTVEDMLSVEETNTIKKKKKKRQRNTSPDTIILPDIILTEEAQNNNEVNESSSKLSKKLKVKIADKDQTTNGNCMLLNENEFSNKKCTQKSKKLKTKTIDKTNDNTNMN